MFPHSGMQSRVNLHVDFPDMEVPDLVEVSRSKVCVAPTFINLSFKRGESSIIMIIIFANPRNPMLPVFRSVS